MTSLDTAINYILPEKRMRISQFAKLNDPFELMGARSEGRDERIIFRVLRDYWYKHLGAICMIKHWESPLMWAHYAKNHTGVCLGFDIPDGKAEQMIYENERIKILIDLAKPAAGLTENDVKQILLTKYSQWAYEEEWRIFSNLKEKDEYNGEFYLPFGPDLALREIIVGTRCTKSVGSFKKLLKEINYPVTIIKARPAFQTFTIVRQKRVTPIVVQPKG